MQKCSECYRHVATVASRAIPLVALLMRIKSFVALFGQIGCLTSSAVAISVVHAMQFSLARKFKSVATQKYFLAITLESFEN